MRLRPLVLTPLLPLAAVAAVVLTSSGPAAAQRGATTYEATLDVSGTVEIRLNEDTTDVCTDGRDVLLEYVADVDLGQPRKVSVVIANRRVFTSFATRTRSAVHETRVLDYRETRSCPPGPPVSPGEPDCSKKRGTLRAGLTPTPVIGEDPELTPLVGFVSVYLERRGGGDQGDGCLQPLGTVSPRIDTSVVSTLERAGQAIIVPIGVTDATFKRLRPGKAIRRLVRLRGACNDIQVSSGPALGSAARAPRSCTVRGSIYVSLRRARR